MTTPAAFSQNYIGPCLIIHHQFELKTPKSTNLVSAIYKLCPCELLSAKPVRLFYGGLPCDIHESFSLFMIMDYGVFGLIHSPRFFPRYFQSFTYCME